MIHHDGSSIAARAYQHIRSKVLCGDYPAGQRLVTRQLAVEIGASLNPVREALGRLAAEGIIDHVPGAGASVRQPQLEEILELYEFRQALEPFAAQKAAQFITAPELGVLKEVCARQHDLAETLRQSSGHLQNDELMQWFHHEERFHNTLISAARNSHFDRTIRNSRVLTQLFHCHQTIGLKVNLSVAARTWGIHLRIVGALESRNADLAGSLMRTALEQGAQQTLLSSSNALRP